MAPEEAARPVEEVLARVRGSSEAGGRVAARLLRAFDQTLEELVPTLRAAGEKAERAAEKTRGTVARAVEKLAENVDAAWRLRDHALVQDVTRLRERLFPEGIPQERRYGPCYFAARHGERPFLERVLAAADPGGTGTRSLAL
jgi:hypothetical protein